MNKYIIALAGAALTLSSCDDFLNREPLDFGNEDAYYKTDRDLEVAANSFYEYLPENKAGWGGLYTEDTNSDNQVKQSPITNYFEGEKRTVKIEDSEWNFKKLRNINFFINKTLSVYDKVTGNSALRDHYLGEGYYFRAYEMFRLLRQYGDIPVLTGMQSDDRNALSANSRRIPRNEAARFILATLDTAAMYMMDYAPAAGRVADGAAYALKARVALFEGSWERYHAGTCFVPGNDKWPGKDLNPGFAFKAGSAEAEVNFFLEQAIDAADRAIALHPIASTMDEYMSLFNSTSAFASNSEAILVRYYAAGVISHSTSAFLRAGGGCGVTRALVNSYVMAESGKPIYADITYKGDKVSYLEFQGRDRRLTECVRPAGLVTNVTTDGNKQLTDTVYYYRPSLASPGNDKSTTGYELRKWYNSDPAQQAQQGCTTAVPLFRSGECYVTYLEAYYMRYGNLGGNCDQYWRALRKRAGVNEDYNVTIAATDLTKENDLGVYSKGKEVDATLYNIRRERRCELIGEGLRNDDLRRWRSLDSMKDYQVEGFNLWDEMYKMYKPSDIAAGQISQKNVSKYLRPLQATATSVVYNGYNFPKPHYLEPLPLSEFALIGADKLYQNPGWSSTVDGPADYSYNCD